MFQVVFLTGEGLEAEISMLNEDRANNSKYNNEFQKKTCKHILENSKSSTSAGERGQFAGKHLST
jgi:hypothetical protein